MKSPKIKGIGEVVTEYGAKVMKVIKKGLLGRSLFDFYGDVKTNALRVKESSSVPLTPNDKDGGVVYVKNADGKLYYKSNEVAEVELSAHTGLSTEEVQDIAGALVATGGTKTGIAVTYQDATGDVDFVIDHDAATNFVAEEHVDWAASGAGTIHTDNYIENVVQTTITGNAGTATLAADATTLATPRAINGVDFDGSAPITVTAAGSTLSDTVTVAKGGTGSTTLNDTHVLIGNGTSAIEDSAPLNFDTSSETLTIGNDDNGTVTITRKTHGDEAGGRLSVQSGDATGTNKAGGGLILEAGRGTGSATGGSISFFSSAAGGSATTLRSNVEIAAFDNVGNLSINGSILPGITYIKILPSDFIADDGGRPLAIDDTGSDRWLESHGTNPMFASVEIPVGFKATHVDIYGNGTSAVTVYEADINTRAVTSKGTGNIGTQINITDVTSDATNYLLIQLVQTSGEQVNGGKVTIAKA